MNNTSTSLVPASTLDLELTATTPLEMQQCQTKLIEWCEHKIAAMKHDAAELAESFAVAVKNKWKSSTLKRHADLATKHVTFYEKIKAALDAGYCIVPNFPVTLFAIRTDKTKPATMFSVENYYSKNSGAGHIKRQDAKVLLEGEGEYQNPLAPATLEYEGEVKTEHSGVKHSYTSFAEDWAEIDFPINMAKPNIMEATSHAMAMKIFDEMGILPDPHPKKDPLIVGRILDPRPVRYGQRKCITFIVAWHLNARDI